MLTCPTEVMQSLAAPLAANWFLIMAFHECMLWETEHVQTIQLSRYHFNKCPVFASHVFFSDANESYAINNRFRHYKKLWNFWDVLLHRLIDLFYNRPKKSQIRPVTHECKHPDWGHLDWFKKTLVNWYRIKKKNQYISNV